MGSKREKLTVLFLCTGNSCRSQMAEGFARAAGKIEAYSAGTQPKGLDPRGVLVMKEIGIEIGEQRSKRPEEIAGVQFDVIVTVCDAAHEACPVIPGVRTIHRGFDDPPRLAAGEVNQDVALAHYRRVRDEIRVFVGEMTAVELDRKN